MVPVETEGGAPVADRSGTSAVGLVCGLVLFLCKGFRGAFAIVDLSQRRVIYVSLGAQFINMCFRYSATFQKDRLKDQFIVTHG